MSDIKALATVVGLTGAMTYLRPSHHGPRFVTQSIGRSLRDLPLEPHPHHEGVVEKVAWSAAVLIAMMTLIGWLLIGAPSPS